MMRATDVLDVLDRLAAVDVVAWLDGGWGIDALVGEETRPHDDLDLVIAIEDARAVRAALAAAGFALVVDESPTRFVLGDAADRRVDCHPVTFDADGGGVQRLQDGSDFRYPPEGFGAVGRVGGRAVRCLSAATQVLCHLGYAPDADDRRDMRLLRDRCGVALPQPYDAD